MHPTQAIAIARHVAQRSGLLQTEHLRARLRASLFAQQRAFADDPAKIKAATPGRRAGKTTAGSRMLFLAGLQHSDAFSLYIGITRKNAKLLLWPEIKRVNRVFEIGGKVNESDLTLTLPNGHVIFLGGADTAEEIEKYRSFKYALVLLDECGSMGPHIRSLIEDVTEAATMDLDGTIAAIGTPGPVCVGKFWEMTAGPAHLRVPTHRWTALENPHIPDAAAWLAERRAQHGWDEHHPTYLREWMGQWVPDHTALVYQYDAHRNNWDGRLPEGHAWVYTLGIDIGYNPDPTAFVVVAWSYTHTKAYAVHAEKHLDWIPSRIAEHIATLRERYNIVRIVADVGATRGLAEEWALRFKVPLTPPLNKQAKREHIEMLNDDLRTGNTLIANNSELIHELKTVVWDDARKRPSNKTPNDLTDALEYAWIASGHFASREADTKKVLSFDARMTQEADDLERREIKRLHQQQRLARLGV